MNCKDAQKVWGHPDGFLAGIKATFPRVLERLENLAEGLVKGRTNPFCKRVKEKAGPIGRDYYVEHADDGEQLAHQVHDVVGDTAARLKIQQYLSERFGYPIVIGNLCCSGCKVSIGEPTLDEAVAIQNAAVRTDADGSDIKL